MSNNLTDDDAATIRLQIMEALSRLSLANLKHALKFVHVLVAFDKAPESAPQPSSKTCRGFHPADTSSPACCDRAGDYNGFASDGPTIFTCPNSCACHD